MYSDSTLWRWTYRLQSQTKWRTMWSISPSLQVSSPYPLKSEFKVTNCECVIFIFDWDAHWNHALFKLFWQTRCMDCDETVSWAEAFKYTRRLYKCKLCNNAYRCHRSNTDGWNEKSREEQRALIVRDKYSGGRGKKERWYSANRLNFFSTEYLLWNFSSPSNLRSSPRDMLQVSISDSVSLTDEAKLLTELAFGTQISAFQTDFHVRKL